MSKTGGQLHRLGEPEGVGNRQDGRAREIQATVEIFVGQDEGRWPKGTRVKKVMSRPEDTHQDGALGTIVGALGPITASQRAESIIALAKEDVDGDVEYIYWVEWDDIPGIPVAVKEDRIEPIGE